MGKVDQAKQAMNSIPRYKINILWGWYGFTQDNESGKFCEYRDYVKLKAENERLRKAGDAMYDLAVKDSMGLWVMPPFENWSEKHHTKNATKEGQ